MRNMEIYEAKFKRFQAPISYTSHESVALFNDVMYVQSCSKVLVIAAIAHLIKMQNCDRATTRQ